MEDIPEALREQPATGQLSPRSPKWQLWIALLGLVATAVLGGIFFWRSTVAPEVVSSSTPPEPSPELETSSAPPEPSPTPETVEPILGHLPYEEAMPTELTAVTADGSISLQTAAAAKFKQMQADAKAEGVILTALSGYRSTDQQNYLFFGIKEQRGQVTTKRAEISAPPGHSEHHTGYAIDIGDGRAPATNLSESFEHTAAFRWLEANAPRYSFELSFPRDNPQGISYEPWHWRFVGDSDSLKTFYRAKKLQPTTQNQP